MPLIQRYTITTQGAMVLTGNTCSIMGINAYPTQIATDLNTFSYITTNTTLISQLGYPNGTTLLANQASSSARLNIPSNSQVLFAQLYWTLWHNSTNIDNNITLITPTTTVSIAPDLSLKQIGTEVTWQAQDVTTIVNTSSSGTYTVSNLPGENIVPVAASYPTAWYLMVVYKNTSLPYRYFNINTGYSLSSSASPSDLNFTGFVTPTSGTVSGYLIVSQSNGDLTDNAQILVGADLGSAVRVGNASTGTWNGVAPYAQIDNMLPGMILNADTNDTNIGLLDTRGTLGTYNKSPFATTAAAFSRNNADIFGLNISNRLTTNQNTLFTRVSYGGSGSGVLTNQSIQIDLNSANITNLSKSVNKSYAGVSTTLTYTISFSNTGLINANNIVLMDTLPNGVSFVSGSVNINGITSLTANPQLPGIRLGNITSNQAVTVTFNALVTPVVPAVTSASNNCQITYSFTPGVGLPSVSSDAISNTVTTTLINATLYATKQVNKSFTALGEILAFTIPIANVGNTITNNIYFMDTIPSGLTVITGSFMQDGVTINTLPNPPGIILGNVAPQSTSTITYRALVSSIPQPNSIYNSANIIYDYTIDSSAIPPLKGYGATNTNITLTTVNSANLNGINKSADMYYAKCADIITFTITLPNNGNTTAYNVVFIDTIPTGTEFIANSVTINGLTAIGQSPAPPSGINLGSIPGGNSIIITFKVRVLC